MAAPVILSPATDPYEVSIAEGADALGSVSFLGVPLSVEPALSGPDAALFVVIDQGAAAAYTSPVLIDFVGVAEAGSYEVTLTLENTGGTDSVTFDVTVYPPPVNSVAPYITYGGFVGRTQEINEGTWDGTPTSYTYQWGRANDGSGTGAASISGATNSTYTFQSADEGKYVYCDVIAYNAAGASDTERSNYRFCYERVALPTPTELARTFDDLSGYDGKELFTEPTVDTSAAMPDPVTWKAESPQNTKDFSFFSVAVDTSTRARDNNSGCVKISENWGMVANHVPGNGDAYIFLNTDGDTEISVGYDSTVQLGDTSVTTSGVHDIRLIHFDAPVSDAEVPPLALPTTGMYNAFAGQYCLAIERGRHLNRLLLDAGNSSSDPDTTWAATTADVLEDGDSGKAVFLFADGTPVAVGTNVELTTSAPNPAHWLREIQDVLASTGDEVTLVKFEFSGSGGGLSGSIGSNIMRSIGRADQDDIEL